MPDAPLASFVIPVFNNWNLTRDCLTTLRQHTNAPIEVIVVDNGSTDATATEAPLLGKSLFNDGFRFLRRDDNLGFARATNLGAREAEGTYLYLLNNDTIIASDPVSAPVERLRTDPTLGATGPLLTYPGGERVQHLGITVAHGIKSVHLYHLFPASHPVVAKQRRLQAITMAAFCIERELYLRLGGLHEEYLNGMEDIDFCARMQQEGLACSVATGAVVHHIAGQSAGRHAQDAHNSRLLGSRCSQLLQADMNLLAREDGFAMRLTPWLDPYLILGAEREKTMAADWEASCDPEALPELLDREPCWERGWDMLANHFRDSGNPTAELVCLVQKSAFLPTPVTFSAMRDAATRAGDSDRLAVLDEQDRHIQAALTRPATLRAQAKAALRRGQAAGNHDLADILSGWLTEHHPDGGDRS